MELTWLGEWPQDAVREALAGTAPDLAREPLVLRGGVDASARWASGSATVAGRFHAKFALSAITARRIWHETEILRVLAGLGLPVPDVVAGGGRPAHLVTRLAAGGPLSFEYVGAAGRPRLELIAGEIAGFAAALHQPETLEAVTRVLGEVRFPEPGPQATTGRLREDLVPWLGHAEMDLVHRWCDWTDKVLAIQGEPVFVHGDLHGYNWLWDLPAGRLHLVLDLETSGAAEAEYEFRFIPSLGPGVRLLLAVAAAYRERTGRELSLERIMGWHVRSHLGDVLWRSEKDALLPGRGTAPDYVAVLAARFAELGIGS